MATVPIMCAALPNGYGQPVSSLAQVQVHGAGRLGQCRRLQPLQVVHLSRLHLGKTGWWLRAGLLRVAQSLSVAELPAHRVVAVNVQNKRKWPKGVHYGHMLTSKVADCISPRQRWDILKRRKKTIRAQHNQESRINPASNGCSASGANSFQKKFLSARATDHPVYSAPLCGPFAMLYWQSCADVRPMCYITPSVHVRAYIQN